MKFGPIASMFQLFVLLFGYPMQALAIYRTGTAESVSMTMYVIFLGCHVFWALHAHQVRDKYVFLPQIPSVILVSTILCQCIWYTYLA